MARDEFSKQTLDSMAKRVGVRCSNPSCRKLTTGPRIESHLIVNIGVAAHITAASRGGPRFDVGMSPEQRQSPENGIWLCQNCAKLVDNDCQRYTVGLLQTWKQRAEESAQAEVEGRTIAQPSDFSAEVDLSYSKERIESERHDYRLQVKIKNLGTEPLGPYHIDVEMPARVIERPRDVVGYVHSRSSREVNFFRISSRNHQEEIYPGDVKLVMSLPYFMNDDIFFNQRGLFDCPVMATLYRPGFRPFTIEQRFEEFQVF